MSGTCPEGGTDESMKIKDKIWAVLFKRERFYDIVEPLGDIEPDERTRSRIESWRLIGKEDEEENGKNMRILP
jgi:hypothetical protein